MTACAFMQASGPSFTWNWAWASKAKLTIPAVVNATIAVFMVLRSDLYGAAAISFPPPDGCPAEAHRVRRYSPMELSRIETSLRESAGIVVVDPRALRRIIKHHRDVSGPV